MDLAIVGAGPAGLTAGIRAGEAAADAGRAGLRIVVLDGAATIGTKILVSGGGRCNVTNETVTEADFWGGSRNVIRRVLRAFDHHATVDWMRSLGVDLKREPTGKLFPTTDSARTVLDALLARLHEVGVELRSGARVTAITPLTLPSSERSGPAIRLTVGPARGAGVRHDTAAAGPAPRTILARRVILATGGRALPKSGSDGWGLDTLARLGHTIIPTTPALSPLVVEPIRRARAGAPHALADLQGITIDAALALHTATGKRVARMAGSLLVTHFGLSGPAALDLSRHVLRHRLGAPEDHPVVRVAFVPDLVDEPGADAWLRGLAVASPRRSVANALTERLPARVAQLIAGHVGTLAELSKGNRRQIAADLVGFPVRVDRDRGWAFAETTAGGVALAEVDVRTMASRVVPALHLAGEVLDVDGRLGGFNFQWAWSTGLLAARGAVAAL